MTDNETIAMQMLNPDMYLLTRHVASILVVGAGVLGLGLVVLGRERWSRVGIRFLLVAIAVSVWLLSFGMAYASRQELIAIRWFRIGDIGVTFIPPAFFALVTALIQQEHRFRVLVRTCGALSLLFCGSVFLSDLFVAGLYRYPWGIYPRYGILGLLFLLYFCAVMGSGLVLVYRAYRDTTHPQNRQRFKWLLRSFGIGFVSAVDFAAKLGIPLYPFGYLPLIVYLIIASWLIVRFRLVDITPELATNEILETMQGAVIVADLEGRIRVVNRVAQEMLGYARAELLGRDLASVLTVPDALAESVRTGQRATFHETVWTGRGGRQHHVSLSASLLTDGRSKDPAGVVFVAHDITELKLTDEKLKASAADLQEVNEELKNFAYIVSHDLRAPLMSVKGFSQELESAIKDLHGLLQKRLPEMDAGDRKKVESLMLVDVPEAVHFIGSSASRMDRMINSILSLSRMSRRQLKPELLDMGAIVRGILDSLAHQIADRRIDVAVAQFPPVMADKSAMEQVLGNLLDNAVKYLDPCRPGRIAVTAENGGQEIVVHVRDNGRGMAQEDIPKAFELFRRVGKHDVPGEGMGLAYVRALVRSMGGRIWCQSEQGNGTTFSFSLPQERSGA